jgi:hypothetical protein
MRPFLDELSACSRASGDLVAELTYERDGHVKASGRAFLASGGGHPQFASEPDRGYALLSPDRLIYAVFRDAVGMNLSRLVEGVTAKNESEF